MPASSVARGTTLPALLRGTTELDQSIAIGETAAWVRSFSSEDVLNFAHLSGDHNPVHLDEIAASRSPFGSRVVHGLLAASQFSALIASKLPGPGSIYLEQTLRFLRPIHLGEAVEYTLRVIEVPKPRVYRLETIARVVSEAEPALSGIAVVLAPRQPPIA